MNEIGIIIQTAFKFCISVQTNWKPQSGLMVEFLSMNLVAVGLSLVAVFPALRKSYKVTHKNHHWQALFPFLLPGLTKG